MKKLYAHFFGYKFWVLATALIGGVWVASHWEKLEDQLIPKEWEHEEGEYEDEEDENEQQRSEDIAYMEFMKTRDLSMNEIPKERLMDAMHYRDEMTAQLPGTSAAPVAGVMWQERGPSNVSGRIRAILVDSRDNTGNTVLVGGVGGGVWRTTNAQAATPTWNKINDFFDNIAVSSLAQDPSNPSTIYFGTGEGWFNSDAIQGLGIWKSTDGGLTFSQLASTNNNSFFFVQKIKVDAGGNIFAATRGAGLQYSSDGGMTWGNILATSTILGTMNPKFPTNRVADIEIAADGDIYAAVGIGTGFTDGIYRSTDGGATWTFLNNGSNGLPTTGYERIELAVAPSNANRLYALFESSGTPASCMGIYTTTDGGNNWTSLPVPTINDNGNTIEFTRGQAWYDLICAVDPNSDTRLFIGGVDLMESVDGGNTFFQISSWVGVGGFQTVHADHHAIELVYDPNYNTNGRSAYFMFFGNDGGFYTGYNVTGFNLAPAIMFKGNDLNITQFYSTDQDPGAGSNIIIGGTQDNGTQYFDMTGIEPTVNVTGGDGGFAHIDQDQPAIQVGATTYNRYQVTNDSWGTKTNVNFPLSGRPNGMFINPTDYDDINNVLFGSYRTQWYTMIRDVGNTNVRDSGMVSQIPNGHIISAVEVSPNVNDRVYFGTDNGAIVRVDNASTAAGGTIAGTVISPPGGGYVSNIEVEVGDENHILMTFSNYGINSVWESRDGGSNWTSIEGNLPDMPIRWITLYPGVDFIAFVGTEVGVWSTNFINGGSTVWGPTNGGLANTRIDMLNARSADGVFTAASHGRGMFQADIPPFTDFAVAKSFDSVTVLADGHSRAWFSLTACNIGLDTLDGIEIRDTFRFPDSECDPVSSIYLPTFTYDDDLTFTGAGISGTTTAIYVSYSGDAMAPGDCDTLVFAVTFQPNTAPAPGDNYAYSTATGRTTGLMVSDVSNVGTMAFPDSMSATPYFLPSIDVVKWVDSVYLVMTPPDSVGNFQVMYKMKIANTGNVAMDHLTLYDNLDDPALLGTGYMASMGLPQIDITYPASPAYSANPAYDGVANDSIFLSSSGVTIPAGDSIILCMRIMVNPNAAGAPDTLYNQAIATGRDPVFAAMVFDTSDYGRNELTSNGSGDCNDPTPLNLVDINISKQILAVRPYNQGTNPGDVLVDFQLLVKNKGNVPIYDIMVTDPVTTNLGATLVSVINAPSLVVPPQIIHGAPVDQLPATVSPTIMAFPKVIDGSMENDTLDRDEFLDIRYTLLTNPNAIANPSYTTLLNQAIAMGDSQVGMTVDTSDTGWDPENRNAGALGDSGMENDPTLVTLPILNIAKKIEKVYRPLSGVQGNFDAVYRIYFENTGNTPLDSIVLNEDLSASFGPYFVQAVSVTIENNTASIPPAVNPSYSGMAPNQNLVISSPGTLVFPGEGFEVVLRVEIDPDAGGLLCDSLANQVLGMGRANDNAGNTILDASLLPMITYDSSDAGIYPETLNPEDFADRGTGNDSTRIPPCWKDEPTCQDMVNISLGSDCQVLINPGMILNGVSFECIALCFWEVTSIKDMWGNDVPNPVTGDYAGQTLTISVRNIVTNNVCWSKAKIEEKFPPQIICQNDTISCLEMDAKIDLVLLEDNCQMYPARMEVLEKQWTDLGCDDREFIGYMARKVRATDAWGNFRECRDTLFVRKETIDSLICGPDTLVDCNLQHQLSNGTWVDVLWQSGKNGYTYLDDQGYAHPWPTDDNGIFPAPYLKSTQPGQEPGYLLPKHTDAGPDFANSGKCQIVFEYEDHVIPTCGKAYKIRRTWHIYDWCGGRDTTCVQWFKVQDHTPPFVMEEMLGNIKLLPPDLANTTRYILSESKDLYVAADPHDCKAGLQLADVRNYVERRPGKSYAYECDDELTLYYEVSYSDPSHPGKQITQQGDYDKDGGHLYLPAGWHYILWTIRDRCWNEFTIWQRAFVEDVTPPTPVCDEITQVTLDPKECWACVYAKDLDDGSHDNCCDKLHFAVASMDSITYWRDYWTSYFEDCLDPYDYHHYRDDIDEAIEEWINVFVFDDYIDVTECGSEQLVLRVYEACDVPEYDPHTFYGGEHEWYWWNLSQNFLQWYFWRLDDYVHYGDPRASFKCDIEVWKTSNQNYWNNPFQVCLLEPVYKTHGTYPSRTCGYLLTTEADKIEWQNRVFNPYREESLISFSLSDNKRWHFPHLYSDCMIEVRKDDKTPPVVVAPEDVTVYCDGVPYWWTLTKSYAGGTKTATVNGHGASFTHDVCEGEDALQTYCSSPDVYPAGINTSGDLAEGPVCCVEIPWDGGDFGYYGGSVCGEYSYAGGVNCDEYSYWYHDHNWQPIYCRLWLMLDKYDNPDGGHPNPQSYFDETAEDWVITDNCWAPETEVEYSGSLNECGVGTLTKTVTATDKCGNTAYDTQTLYVKPRSDFEVIFPADVVVNCTDQASLAADRTGAGYPEISDDDCELIGVTYSDERYDVTEGCYKILRTWKLIDWCVYSPDLHSRYPDVIVDDRLVASESRCCIHRNLKDDGDGYMTYLQVIKVIDDEAPVIVCNELEETCILDNNCDAATVRYELLASGTDNCAAEDEIQYRYTVLADETTPVAYGQGHELTAELAVGTYGVWLVGKDRCGNEDSCYTTFTIRDCKNPTPYCYHGIATVVMSPSGEVEIWATDFDAGSYDNCTYADKLIFSFTEDGETPSWTYTCADIPDGRSQEIEVEIWVIDEAGNKDFCTTTLLLQDNTGNACQDSSPLTESGSGVASPGQKVKGEGVRTPELYQNTPNPFSGETKIGFWLPESMTATLKIMDVTGKELYRVSGTYSGGNHLITLEAGSIPEVKGVLFYQLETISGVLNKRMVKVN
ncbi:MAG: hypothetical protein H6570_15040 [Lewinellaceae bacterium]|nr:hypothetical protein [Lewinellaceae bacterium]